MLASEKQLRKSDNKHVDLSQSSGAWTKQLPCLQELEPCSQPSGQGVSPWTPHGFVQHGTYVTLHVLPKFQPETPQKSCGRLWGPPGAARQVRWCCHRGQCAVPTWAGLCPSGQGPSYLWPLHPPGQCCCFLCVLTQQWDRGFGSSTEKIPWGRHLGQPKLQSTKVLHSNLFPPCLPLAEPGDLGLCMLFSHSLCTHIKCCGAC